jgi:hypothetical protein
MIGAVFTNSGNSIASKATTLARPTPVAIVMPKAAVTNQLMILKIQYPARVYPEVCVLSANDQRYHSDEFLPPYEVFRDCLPRD